MFLFPCRSSCPLELAWPDIKYICSYLNFNVKSLVGSVMIQFVMCVCFPLHHLSILVTNMPVELFPLRIKDRTLYPPRAFELLGGMT